VIRAASPLYVGLFGLALARSTRIPVVVRVGANHDKYFETTNRPMEPRLWRSRKVEKALERFVFRQADLVAGANQDNLDFALANGASPERATLFRYGNLLDSRHFVPPAERAPDDQFLRELGLEPGKFLLYVGRLEPIKHPDHVLYALAAVRQRGFDVKALLAGEGSSRAALERQARELGLQSNVVLAGNVPQGRLAQLYPAAAAIVSPHTGRALTEAALGEAAVAAYDVDWQGEIIETDKTGILVQHGDVGALGEAVASLLSDHPKARALGQALRKRALQILDPEALNDHERAQYRKLLQQRPS
jgi:glycosyltransferase involved in cell wall biosynthesis